METLYSIIGKKEEEKAKKEENDIQNEAQTKDDTLNNNSANALNI